MMSFPPRGGGGRRAPLQNTTERALARSRLLVIIEAALEYFIHICVTTTCLTAILDSMGVSTSLQGIINAITSLACSVQLLAVFGMRRTYPCKRWVCILNLINQLLFALLYCVPGLQASPELRVGIFIGLLLAAYACQHFLTPSRVNWQMSLLDDNKRGTFTAHKEMVSLIGGMLVSQGAGILLDHFKEKGDMQRCFLIFGITITVLSLLHLLVMYFTVEPVPDIPHTGPEKGFREICATVFGERDLRRVVIFDALFVVSTASLHFYSVYLVATFGLPYTYITTVAIVHAAFRAAVSHFLGKLADKKSWAYMLRVCMSVLAVGLVVFLLCDHENVKFLYPVFSICYAFSMGGTNAGRTNLCLDYAKHEDRRYILGIMSAISGVCGFLVTLAASALVERIEQNGNALFGISMYPQQLLFGISAVMLLALAFFYLPLFSKPARITQSPLGEEP